MNAMESILARRSIRSYTGEAITKEELDLILKAAYAAPVGMGRYDSLHITVVTNRAFLHDLDALTAKQQNRPGNHPLYGAPMLIILSSVFPGIPTDNSSYSNCAILSENIALSATSLGIGACHIWGAIRTLNTAPDLLEKLHLPEGFSPCCAVILGRTEERYAARDNAHPPIATSYLT